MEKEINQHPQPISPGVIEELRSELNDLDQELIEIDGHRLKPSQCYHFDVDPVHML
ncbi:MAG: hypothetical protein H7Y01_15260, partial [Ferruginibacter sp.]|nr:hypothetical protein [Chitinophagaceae bacterium]